jgi:hypothetical protein
MLGGELFCEASKLSIYVVRREVLQGKPVTRHRPSHELILTARHLGQDFPIGMQQVQHRPQIAPHRIEQVGPLELGGHHREGAVQTVL